MKQGYEILSGLCENASALLTGDEWCKVFGITMVDDDGWRCNRISWTARISLKTFLNLVAVSTVYFGD